MDEEIRILIRQKLKDGRLPFNSMARFWGGPADGELCDACDKPITKQQLVMEGISVSSTLSDRARDKKSIQLHVKCFQIWDAEKRAPKT
jgi:hypothetical protein